MAFFWSPDDNRILCAFGGDSPGIFSIRASDGGDPVRLSTNPYGSLSQNVMVVNTCGTNETFDLKVYLDAWFSTQPNNNPGNAVTTLAAVGVASFSFVNSTSLTLGSVDPAIEAQVAGGFAGGVLSTGTISITAGGAGSVLTVANPVNSHFLGFGPGSDGAIPLLPDDARLPGKADQSDDQGGRHSCHSGHRSLVLAEELLEAIKTAWRMGFSVCDGGSSPVWCLTNS